MSFEILLHKTRLISIESQPKKIVLLLLMCCGCCSFVVLFCCFCSCCCSCSYCLLKSLNSSWLVDAQTGLAFSKYLCYISWWPFCQSLQDAIKCYTTLALSWILIWLTLDLIRTFMCSGRQIPLFCEVIFRGEWGRNCKFAKL